MSSITKIVLLISIVIAVVIFFFYYVLHTREKDISTNNPFAVILNKKLVAVDAAVLIKNSTTYYTDDYPEELTAVDTYDLSVIKHVMVPKESVFTFYKALEITNATSGYTRRFLLGEVVLANTTKNHLIIYSLGFLKTFGKYEQQKNYWDFAKAPWENVKKENFYVK